MTEEEIEREGWDELARTCLTQRAFYRRRNGQIETLLVTL